MIGIKLRQLLVVFDGLLVFMIIVASIRQRLQDGRVTRVIVERNTQFHHRAFVVATLMLQQS